MSPFVLPTRSEDGHKGTFGSVCVIGGQRSESGIIMFGAPALTANACLRSGCGKALLAMPQPVLQSGLLLAPSATGIELPVDEVGRLLPSAGIEALDANASDCRCIAIGPGFGSDWPQQQIIATLLARENRPVVLDADGLNALAQLPSGQLELRAPTILTPHVGEYERLAGAMGITVDASNHVEAAEALAQAYGCVVVLKSDVTVISDGVRSVKESGGSVVLATGGSGDVLTGIIAGTLVQFGKDCITHLFDAGVLAVRVHALAGESFKTEHGNAGMLATDLLDRIPSAIGRV